MRSDDGDLVKDVPRGRRRKSKGGSSRPAFVALAGLLVLVALTGGGSRADILSLLILRPVSAVLFAYAVVFHGQAAWTRHPVAMRFAAAVLGLMLLQLVPLPPFLWTMLPGRTPLAEGMAAAGMALPWLPIAMAPADGWNALFAMMAPVAALILAIAAKRDEQILLLRMAAVGLVVSGLVGLFQIIGPDDGPLYYYALTNKGSAVGLFANRNHQAMALACIFPLLAMHVSLLRRSELSTRFNKRLALAAAVLIVPLMLVTGSRAGLVSLMVGLVGAAWVYCEPQVIGRVVKNRGLAPVQLFILGSVVLGLLIVTILASRAEAVDRLLAADATANIRAQALPTIGEAIWTYFPVGSGFGSFVPVYQQLEPGGLLNDTYLNHAHNEFAEMLMTGGLPALLILLGLAAAFVLTLRKAMTTYASVTGDVTDIVLQRTGLVMIIIFVIGSMSDYPMRTPLIAVLTALAIAAALAGWRQEAGQQGR